VPPALIRILGDPDPSALHPSIKLNFRVMVPASDRFAGVAPSPAPAPWREAAGGGA
jgi:hypothetical protein